MGHTFDEREANLIDELTYKSYAYNRSLSRLPAASWAVIFPDWQRFEQRYQQEAANEPTQRQCD